MNDLFDLAEANRAVLETEFQSRKATRTSLEAQQLDIFADGIATNSQVAMNARALVLRNIISGQNHQNIYEYAKEQSELSGRSEDEIFREQQGKWGWRRTAFDSEFANGKKFRYGSLNVGGAGASKYGEFCILLRPDIVGNPKNVAYLKYDSAKHYVSATKKFEYSAISSEVAAQDTRHLLASLKCSDQLNPFDINKGYNLISSEDDYIEAVFNADVSADSIDKVRINDLKYKNIFSLAFDDYGRDLQPGERALANDFVQILKFFRSRNQYLERV